ncbi:permease [Tepiditoga spiralis]|uniref:Permease n=1 Tax=Tepiditoga spiralis TaxID=2108365 RepID=A0A7G1G7C0_9BACT|nr:NCS2 family permease [Tepiditoga spiralis]BBE31074.1 permease [Tepiditoga spiralis]
MDKFFKISESGSTVKNEIFGGIATFLTMAYIIFVNPSILSSAIKVDGAYGALMVATILGGAVATLTMGLLANYPFALAPGMGLNAYFTYTVVMKMGVDWRVALGAVFIEGLIFILITLVGVRTYIANAIPHSIKIATSAGIGLFITFIGLKNAGIVVSDPATYLALGKITTPEALTTIIGLLIIAALYALRVPGSILIGILLATIFGAFVGITKFNGVFGPIPNIAPTFFKLKLTGASLIDPSFWVIVLTFFFVDFFDTTGTLMGLANSAGMTDKEGNLPRATKAYMADATGTSIGALFGTSTVTTYIESGAGIAQGARTGLASVVTAGLMLLMLFMSPLASSIPAAATAPALIFVGSLMIKNLKIIDWDDTTEGLPAFITLVMMPLTYSIATGITLGMIVYPIVKLFSGKAKDVHWLTWVLGFLFILYLIYLR